MWATALRGKIRTLWLAGLSTLLGVAPALAQGQYPANWPAQPPAVVLAPQAAPAPPGYYGPPPGQPVMNTPYAPPNPQQQPSYPQGNFPRPPTQAPQPPQPAVGYPGGPQPLINQYQTLPVQSRTVVVAAQQPGQPPMPPAGLVMQAPQGSPLPPPTPVPGSPTQPDGQPAPVVHNVTETPTTYQTSGDPWANLPFYLDFKDGVFFKSQDDFFSLRINNLLQIDYRDFSHTAQGAHTPMSLHDNFTLAREWLIFRGNVSELVDYTTIIAGGAAGTPTGPAAVNVLDAYLDFNPLGKDGKEYLQVRVGRFKTPFLYQFYKVAPQDFVAPELSMFSTNFSQNREIGLMAHGLLLDKRLDYALGVFNGRPNSFEVSQSDRQGICFVAFQPFVQENNSLFKNLIVSGSYAFGEQQGLVDPADLGTAVPANGPPANLLISPTFLRFSPTAVTQAGFHQLWAAEVIWSVRSFNLYAEYTGGQQRYALATAPAATFPVSVSGYSVASTYFFTGEEITPDRKRVKPLRPYDLKCGGTGAVEGFFRYSNLVLGSNVFTDKLADPAAFANRVNATDVGVNWYLNEYVKVVFDWQHSMFNQPVSYTGLAGGNSSRNEDLFWLRFQLYY